MTDDTPAPRLVYTAATAAHAVSVSARTIRDAINSGDLPAYRMTPGGPRFIRHADLARWVESFTPDTPRRAG